MDQHLNEQISAVASVVVPRRELGIRPHLADVFSRARRRPRRFRINILVDPNLLRRAEFSLAEWDQSQRVAIAQALTALQCIWLQLKAVI
jgi:hypothetical protein